MISRPRGTRDILPDEIEGRRETEAIMRETARRYGYREIVTPTFEEQDLFTIRSGEGIIDEMYTFEDKGGRKMTLRPEITAPVLRCFVNEGRSLPKPVKWYYVADCFRYERPQKGRYRQFWQFGIELIGVDSAMADAEIILVADEILQESGISYTLQIGDLSLMRHVLQDLSSADKKTIRTFLDKRDIANASAFLSDIGRNDIIQPLTDLVLARSTDEIFTILGDIPEKERILSMFSILDDQKIRYTINPAIARGLDYYTGMVFEGFAEGLGAENQVIGGGAYRLAHLFGGQDTPSCGFAIGFDRVMVARGDKKPSSRPRVFVITTKETQLLGITAARHLREAGICTETDLSGKGFGGQMSLAAKIAGYVLIIGKQEMEKGTMILKDLQSGEQQEMTLHAAIVYLTSQ